MLRLFLKPLLASFVTFPYTQLMKKHIYHSLRKMCEVEVLFLNCTSLPKRSKVGVVFCSRSIHTHTEKSRVVS